MFDLVLFEIIIYFQPKLIFLRNTLFEEFILHGQYIIIFLKLIDLT